MIELKDYILYYYIDRDMAPRMQINTPPHQCLAGIALKLEAGALKCKFLKGDLVGNIEFDFSWDNFD
ncbi:MAG: hypothetical protein ACTSR2_13515, partial [Candidatus Hodarchaeales archaeon]